METNNGQISEIVIICPANSVTGGPELLHQLASFLNSEGISASICYYPFGSQKKITPHYSHYNTPVIELPTNLQSFAVIASEYHTKILSRLEAGKKIVWWLSVDNYYRFKTDNLFKNNLKRILGPLMFRTPIHRMKDCIHLAQSEYAIDFLAKQGQPSLFLGDYLSKHHQTDEPDYFKHDWIAYNPKKSSYFIAKISKMYPELIFKPISGMSPDEVSSLLGSCKLYLDFGRHPGKDRLPREAVLAGCCVVTGRRGSANNKIDIPIPEKYKLSDKPSYQNLRNVKNIISEIFLDYESKRKDFDEYRSIVSGEYERFQSDARKIFGGLLDAQK